MEKNTVQEFDGKNCLSLRIRKPAEYLVYRAVKRKECWSYTQSTANATFVWVAETQSATIQIFHDKLWESSIIVCYPYNLNSCKAFEHFCKVFRIDFQDFLDGRDLEKTAGQITPPSAGANALPQ